MLFRNFWSIIATAYCAVMSSDLLLTWTTNRSEHWGWLACALWMIPVFTSTLQMAKRSAPGNRKVLLCAILVCFVGQITWLNCLQHAGLAIALCSWVQIQPRHYAWMVSSIFWMPLFGWIANEIAWGGEMPLRIGAILIAVLPTYRLPHSIPMPTPRLGVFLVVLILGGAKPSRADTLTYSSVQSPARPFGLNIVDRVAVAGSDAASADFQENVLPEMQQLVNDNLGERVALPPSSVGDGLIALDPSRLQLSVATDVRAYFVGEGAGYHNTLGFNTLGGGIDAGDPLLIFPDASSPNSYLSSGGSSRTISEPLMPGDFVELGNFEAGTQLDFFLIGNGARGGSNVFSTQTDLNPDGINHVVAFAEVDNPYLLIGFEDLYGGGDRDFNDLVFAVYFGEETIQDLIQNSPLNGLPASEPGCVFVIVAACGGWLYRKRKALPQDIDGPANSLNNC